MIEFSRDKKTSVLICGGEKGKAAPLGSARPLSLVWAASLPAQQIGTSPLWGESILMEVCVCVGGYMQLSLC